MIHRTLRLTAAAFSLILITGAYTFVSAHCDTLDGPVIQDARKALSAGDVTPVLKWVQAKDEKEVAAAFKKALAAKGKQGEQAEELRFFEALVRIHRAGEGAGFTGLKPAGEVEPVIALADKAITEGNAAGVTAALDEAVQAGVSRRFAKVVEAYRHKDESVQQGRRYVAAYVDYVHYVERLHQVAEGAAGDHEEDGHDAGGHDAGEHHHQD